MNDQQVRIGIIGAGGMGGAHAHAYAQDPRALVCAVMDSDPARAQALADKLQAAAYGSLPEMLCRERPHLVSVCTPPGGHLAATLGALQSGCHVLCEKPLARSGGEAARMVSAARRARRLLVTAFCHRFHEPVVIAREWIAKGVIGQVLQFRNRFAGWIPMEGRWFSDPALAGGGSIIDTSIHSIDLFRYLVGDPATVSARTATMVQPIKVEDSSLVLLQTAEGAIGSIEACWSSPVSGAVIEIYGCQGTIIVDYGEPGPRYLRRGGKRWRRVRAAGPDRFVMQARHMLDCVTGVRQPLVTGEDGLWAARVADAAYRSVKEQVWVAP